MGLEEAFYISMGFRRHRRHRRHDSCKHLIVLILFYTAFVTAFSVYRHCLDCARHCWDLNSLMRPRRAG